MKKILVVLILVLAIGCQKKYTKPSVEEAPPPSEPSVQEEVMQPEQPEETKIEEMDIAKEEPVAEMDMSLAEKAQSVFNDVLFDFDKYDIKPEARPTLDAIASLLNDERSAKIIIEGHCDDRGTNEYNLALGERRAKSAKNYLVSRGVSPARMDVVTYGEEKPLCTAQNKTCWQRNRRAHFLLLR
jgi:peptidoglycan-associated lipoprotein